MQAAKYMDEMKDSLNPLDSPGKQKRILTVRTKYYNYIIRDMAWLPYIDAVLPFDSTASNVCHNTRLVDLTQAYTERKEMIRNCQQDDARIWLESKT